MRCAADGFEPLPAGGALHLTGFRVHGKHAELPVERTSVGQPIVGLADEAARPSGGARVRHAGAAPPSVVASRDIVVVLSARVLVVEVAGNSPPRPVQGRLVWFEPGHGRNGSPRAAGKVEFPVLLTLLTKSRVAGIGNRQEV